MRTLQEKYNGIQEGKFSKDQFIVEARMQHPNIITRFNGYDDAVQILKNKGMIQEASNLAAYKIGDQVKFTNGEIWKVAKPGVKGNKVFLAPFNDVAKKGHISLAIEFSADELKNTAIVNEARLTKNSLTDYRYKPTNEMDKYPYEQILRGIRVELEVLGAQATPTPEEYTKALTKVSKNLAKDSIFYTNQLAGVNPKVDLHDKMVHATAKNTVDTFNGMKKATLKEGLKNLIKKALQEEEEVYEMQGPKSDGEYKSELEDYLQDNQIYGYTDMLFDILTAPDEEQVADNLADFLDDHQIYGYNKGLLAIFRDYANRDQSEEEDDLFETVSLKDLL